MAQNRPPKVGEYERPARLSKTTAVIVGLLVLILLIVLAVLIF
jgi:hypothetical protein